MTFKTIASTVGNGLVDGLSAVHNASLQNQITEIDTEMDALRAQLTRLEERRADLVGRKI